MAVKTTGRYRRKAYRDLAFTDDFMFRKVLRSNEKLCRDLIELLLDIRVAIIHFKDDDHTIAIDTGKVFINALSKEADMSVDMRAFLDYLCGMAARTDLTRDIAYSVERAKTYRPWEVEYMHWNEIMSLVEQDARTETQARTRFEAIERFVEEGLCDAARACEILDVDIAAYNEYLAEKAGEQDSKD